MCGENQFFDAVVGMCANCVDVCHSGIVDKTFCMSNCPDYYRRHLLESVSAYPTAVNVNSYDVTPMMTSLPASTFYILLTKPLFWTSVVSLGISFIATSVLVVLCCRGGSALRGHVTAGARDHLLAMSSGKGFSSGSISRTKSNPLRHVTDANGGCRSVRHQVALKSLDASPDDCHSQSPTVVTPLWTSPDSATLLTSSRTSNNVVTGLSEPVVSMTSHDLNWIQGPNGVWTTSAGHVFPDAVVCDRKWTISAETGCSIEVVDDGQRTLETQTLEPSETGSTIEDAGRCCSPGWYTVSDIGCSIPIGQTTVEMNRTRDVTGSRVRDAEVIELFRDVRRMQTCTDDDETELKRSPGQLLTAYGVPGSATAVLLSEFNDV